MGVDGADRAEETARAEHAACSRSASPTSPRRRPLLAAEPAKFFTEPHYNGFPAVLVRLEAVTVADLKRLLADAWRCQAPIDLKKRTAR